MPLDEREREELAKKINQQRRAMWKGQVTKGRQTGKKREANKAEESSIPQPTVDPGYQTVEEEPTEELKEVEQTPVEIKKTDREELAEKIKQQRRTVWKGEPETRARRKKQESRSNRRVLDYQQETEPIEQLVPNPIDEPMAKEKSRDYQSKAPTLKLAVIVILGLIGAIAVGVTIGYLVASG